MILLKSKVPHGKSNLRSTFIEQNTTFHRPLITSLDSVLIAEPGDVPDPSVTKTGQELYFEVLELQPIRLSLSFMRTERVSSEKRYVDNPRNCDQGYKVLSEWPFETPSL